MNGGSTAALGIWWMALAGVAVVVRLLSPGILEGGDGVQHFQIAYYAWKHPELLLHHWGKPLFTLFASPFAQLGHWGMTLFNALCFVVTCWAADGLLRRAGMVARWLFAPALLLVPVYGTMVLAGMTEVFFAMLALLVLRALFNERYVAAMIIVSFMPFARPEYIAFAPFAMGCVVWKRHWRALPFVLTGHVVYGIIGGIVFGDALWAFHHDPYQGADGIYGRGPLSHFSDHLQNIYGAPFPWVLGIALVAGCFLWTRQRDDRPMLVSLLVLAVLPSLAILVVHSVLWWQGWKGSLGLFRVLATTAPLLVLAALWPAVRVGGVLLRTTVGRAVALLIGGGLYMHWAVASFLFEQPLPVVPFTYDRFIRNVGEHVGRIKGQYTRVVFYHPQVAYYAVVDPYNATQVKQGSGPDASRAGHGLEPGDLLVWDAHFGPNEGHTPLEGLLADPELELLEMMIPDEGIKVLGGRPFEAYLFTRRPAHRREEHATLAYPDTGLPFALPHRLDTLPCANDGPGWCFGGGEFPLELSGFPLHAPDLLYVDITVSGQVAWNGDVAGNAELVFAEENSAGRMMYWAEPLRNGGFSYRYRIPMRGSDERNKVYVWNRSGLEFRLTDFRVESTRVFRGQ